MSGSPGVLYLVTKKAGTGNGTVTVAGTDVTQKEIKLGSSVRYGNFTYDIVEEN